jgi:hypothetical protein
MRLCTIGPQSMSRQCIGVGLLAAAVLGGCGSGAGRIHGTGTVPDDRPTAAKVALLRAPRRPGEIIVHGDASPMTHGPFALHGSYVARFEQYAPEDPQMGFAGQTAFVAALTRGRSASRRLFHAAAARGRATVRVPAGSWRIAVTFGDFPYVIRLTPAG